MDKKHRDEYKFVIIGAVLIAVGIALFIAGAVTGLDGQWYLMFIAIPFAAVGIVFVVMQLSKKFIANQRLKSIELIKEIKQELSNPEQSQNISVCSYCGTVNKSASKICKKCGNHLN